MKKIILFTSLVSMVCLSINSFALDKAKQVVLQATRHHVVIKQEFNSIGNLRGFVVQPKTPNSKKVIIYADNQGRYVVVGAIINGKSENISHRDFQKYIQSHMSESAMQQVQKTTYFLQGDKNAPHQLYVVVEPNCSLCHKLYEDLKPYIKAKKLAVRWIITAFLRDNSKGKAAAILLAKNPAVAWDQNEKLFNTDIESGGITPRIEIDKKTLGVINSNTKFIEAQGFPGTPILLYRDKHCKPKVVAGMPNESNIKNIIADMNKNVDCHA